MKDTFELEIETKGLDEMNEGLERAKNNAEQNAGGMNDVDLAQFVEKMKTVKAVALDDEVQAEDLVEALDIPQIVIKQSRNCTFNISITK